MNLFYRNCGSKCTICYMHSLVSKRTGGAKANRLHRQTIKPWNQYWLKMKVNAWEYIHYTLYIIIHITMDWAHWHCYTFTVWIYFSSIIIIVIGFGWPPIKLHKLCSVFSFCSLENFNFVLTPFHFCLFRSSNFLIYMQSPHSTTL